MMRLLVWVRTWLPKQRAQSRTHYRTDGPVRIDPDVTEHVHVRDQL